MKLLASKILNMKEISYIIDLHWKWIIFTKTISTTVEKWNSVPNEISIISYTLLCAWNLDVWFLLFTDSCRFIRRRLCYGIGFFFKLRLKLFCCLKDWQENQTLPLETRKLLKALDDTDSTNFQHIWQAQWLQLGHNSFSLTSKSHAHPGSLEPMNSPCTLGKTCKWETTC